MSIQRRISSTEKPFLKLGLVLASLSLATGCATTQMHRAAAAGDVAEVQRLLQSGVNANCRGSGGATPLHAAAETRNVSVAQVLIENGADVDARRDDGWSPLMLAVCNGHGDAAKTLIAKGADVTARSGNGTTPLHLAAERGHSDVADLLIVNGAATHAKRDDGWTPLMVAAQEGRVEVAGLLLKKGADVGATNLNGTTALYLAAYNGSQVLWTQKVNRSTSGVPTPPLTASDNPYVVVARLLISKGAQPLEIANSDPRALYVNAENHRLVAAYCQELGDWDRSLREYSLAAECFSRALKSCEKPPGESVAKGVAIVGLFVGQASDNAAKVLQQIEEQRAVRAALSGPCNELLNSCRTAAEAVRKMIAGRAAGEPGKTYSGDLPR